MAVQGTDGARGLFIESLEITQGDNVLSIGDVAGYSMALTEMAGPGSTIVMGRDTRPSGDVLKRYAAAGIEAAGGVVIDVGVAPTPAIQKIALQLGAAGAISLTPSHNPHTDAGWKGMLGAEKPSKKQIDAIESRFQDIVNRGVIDRLDPSTYDALKHEQTHLLQDYMDSVLLGIRSTFDDEWPLDGKVVVVDTARGAANKVTPRILEQLGAHVVPFACDTDGLINHNCGATHLGGVRRFLAERPELIANPAFIGAVANDGDADRFMGVGAVMGSTSPRFVTLDGNIALELKATEFAMQEMGVVSTEYVNPATVRRIRAMGLQFISCANGDVNVTKTLREQGWLVGAEPSGHLVDLRLGIPSGDGVYNAVSTAVFAAINGTSFWDICRERRLDPDYLENIPLPQGVAYDRSLLESVFVRTKKDEANASVLVDRKSGTENLVRIRVSGKDARTTYRRTNGIVRAVRRTHQ